MQFALLQGISTDFGLALCTSGSLLQYLLHEHMRCVCSQHINRNEAAASRQAVLLCSLGLTGNVASLLGLAADSWSVGSKVM